MKKKVSFLLVLMWLTAAGALAQKYVYELDLQHVSNDRVKVVLIPPKMEKPGATFIMPKMIPGSYSQKDFGRFIYKFKAFDKQGKALKVKINNLNEFKISNATALARVEYYVNDTWDDKSSSNFVFQPGGSNIEAGKNFVLNHQAFCGYFEGFKMLPYELHIKKPKDMYGATYLRTERKDDQNEVIYADNFVKLVDSPTMYCHPDTTSFQLANARIHIAVYSPNKIGTSAKVSAYLQPLARALQSFFVRLPVDHYHFIFYFAGEDQKNITRSRGNPSAYGALEHSYSSFYFLPEIEHEPHFKGMVLQVAAHEFLHILTPLNIHSEEIEDFDFLNPRMSQHLWMYEGVTEYLSWLVQLRGGLISEEEFMKEMRTKINNAQKYGDFSFTGMSKNVLHPVNRARYSNVYQKGALIAFMLDIQLSQLSQGKYGLRELMLDLAKKYGPSRPFRDEELFDEIYKLTYPEIKTFFEHHIIGQRPIDYDRFLSSIGYRFFPQQESKVYYLGSMALTINNKRYVFAEVGNNGLGIRNVDQLLAINNEAVTADNVEALFDRYFFNNESPDKVRVKIMRDGETMELSALPQLAVRSSKNVIKAKADTDISGEESRLREFLFQGK